VARPRRLGARRRGIVHVYTGEGKGKTTAACGLAVRAAGQGLRVGFFQFFKPPMSGELRCLKKMPNVSVVSFLPFHLAFCRKRKPATSLRDACAAAWQDACTRIAKGRFDLAVLDEVLIAVRDGLLTEEQVIALFAKKPARTELVLTGRGATARILGAADIATEMRCVKHPYPRVAARRGIEY